jgi:hypothetical protein
LIVGIVRLHPCSRETEPASQIRSELPPHSLASRGKTIHAKRNCANRPLLNGKRFDATEDRDQNQPE